MSKTIDESLKKKEEHLNFYLGVESSELKQLMEASKEIKEIIDDPSKTGSEDSEVKYLFRTTCKNLIWYDDWTNNIDSTLTGTDLKINILANELSFINNMLDLLERKNEYSFKDIGVVTKEEKNCTQIYITANMKYPFAEFLFAYHLNDSLKRTGGIKDTMRIVARQIGDHYTIINKDGMNYRYVLKFAKADGTFEYFTVK